MSKFSRSSEVISSMRKGKVELGKRARNAGVGDRL